MAVEFASYPEHCLKETNELDYTISTSGNIINMTYTTNSTNNKIPANTIATLKSNNTKFTTLKTVL